MDTLYEIIAPQNGGAQGASESAGPPAALAPPPRQPGLQRRLLRVADDDAAGEPTEPKGRMLTKMLSKKVRQAQSVKNMLEELRVVEKLGSAVPASDEGLLEAAITLVGNNAQVPVLQVSPFFSIACSTHSTT
jgi:hypothetical protein